MAEFDLTETMLSSQQVFSGVLLQVYKDAVRLPNGDTATREYIKHQGAACVVPVTEDGRVLMERQFRYPFGRVLREIPAGKLDSAQEDPAAAAERELLEETGVRAEKLVYLGAFYPSCAYSSEVIHMYLATGLNYGERKLDEDEFINVEKVPLEELIDAVMAGEIADGKTQTALLKAYYYLKQHR